MKIGKIEIDRQFVMAALQSLFICMAIVLSVVIGRWSMAHEIDTILTYCNNPLVVADKEAGTITIEHETDFMPSAAVNGSCLYEEDCPTIYPIEREIAGAK